MCPWRIQRCRQWGMTACGARPPTVRYVYICKARGLALGHGCFASPEEAVVVVGKRITTLVHDYDRTTPKEMIIWKCGRSCAGHGKADVAKWISDVELYYDKVVSSG